MIDKLNNDEIEKFFDQEEFVNRTIAQIQKDLAGLYDEELRIANDDSNTFLEQIVDLLIPIISILSKRHPEQLSQFIYRVDMKERDFHEALMKDNSFRILAVQIIRREAQKVFLRMKFS